jgi:single-strand DNA-binding protein
MSDLNNVVLVGRLVRDPELRYTPQGAAVCDFTVATNRKFTRKDGEKVEEVAFIDVAVWNRMAEVAAEYLKKGRQVALAGSLVQDRWEDEATGQKRSKIRIQAQSIQFLGGGSKDEGTPEAESTSEDLVAPEPLVVPDAPPPPSARPAAAAQPGKGRAPAKR